MNENNSPPEGSVSVSGEEAAILSQSQILKGRVQANQNTTSFLPLSRRDVQEQVESGTEYRIVQNIFETHESIVALLRSPEDRLAELQEKVNEVMILRGELPPREMGADNPEVLRYRSIAGDELRAFEFVLDGKSVAEIQSHLEEMGVQNHTEKLALILMAAKNPNALSDQEKERALGSSAVMIPLLSNHIQELDQGIQDAWFSWSRESKQDAAVKLGYFLSKAILARDNLKRENPDMPSQAVELDAFFPSTLASQMSGKKFTQRAEQRYEMQISSVNVPTGEQLTENATLRAKIDEEKQLLLRRPDIVDNMGMPFVTALQKLQSGASAQDLFPEEIRAIQNVAAKNPEWDETKIKKHFQNWEKNEEKGAKGIRFDSYYSSKPNFRRALRYAAVLELGRGAEALAGGAEKLAEAAKEKGIVAPGKGGYLDPNQENIDHKNTGNLAGRVFTPGGLATYYVGIYGGAMTVLLNLVSCVQSEDWNNPYLAAGAAMLYGGKTYLDGKWELPGSGKGKPYQMISEIVNNKGNRFDILHVLTDKRELAVLQKIDFTKKGQTALKQYKIRSGQQIDQEKKEEKEKTGKAPTSGDNYHREVGAVLRTDRLELSPGQMLSSEFSGVFGEEKPTEEEIGRIPDDWKVNTARLEAIEYLYNKGITSDQLFAVTRHAQGVLDASKVPPPPQR